MEDTARDRGDLKDVGVSVDSSSSSFKINTCLLYMVDKLTTDDLMMQCLRTVAILLIYFSYNILQSALFFF